MDVEMYNPIDAADRIANKAQGSAPTPKGKRKNAKFDEEKNKIENLVNVANHDPKGSQSAIHTVKKLMQMEEKDKKKDNAMENEKKRLRYIRIHNAYIFHPIIYSKYLFPSGVEQVPLSENVPFEYAQARHDYVKSVVASITGQEVFKESLSAFNDLLEQGLLAMSFPAQHFSEKFEQHRDYFEPEISEESIEMGEMLGLGSPLIRLGAKYMKFIMEIRKFNLTGQRSTIFDIGNSLKGKPSVVLDV